MNAEDVRLLRILQSFENLKDFIQLYMSAFGTYNHGLSPSHGNEHDK